ncbi:MAG: DUF3179 domain-containing protein [Acidimicrobiia bacterium]|nr:DUF3179 domain-containing protein [Acidimicrobiia bacterium]
MKRQIRYIAAVAAFGLSAAACGAGSDQSGPVATVSDAVGTTTVGEEITSTTTEVPSTVLPPEGLSALDAAPNGLSGIGFPEPLIDTDRLLQGQVPDGIPAVDEPRFIDVTSADEWLTDDEAVVVVAINGDVRAYPVQILIWHEIINDTVGDVPVAITYCPLCNSAVTYQRTVDGQLTTFGTSGLLFNSALVMYDRATESLWTHFDGKAVAGVRTGTQLQPISSPLLAWADFKTGSPDGTVLDVARTGYERPYGSNPYVGYDDIVAFPFLFDGRVDDRAAEMQRVVGVNLDGVSAAWTLEAISGSGPTATADSVGDTPVVILWKPGQSSALDIAGVAGGRDVGSVGVFRPEIGDRKLTFEAADDGFQDVETGSSWNVLGQAVAGELTGESLERIAHLDTFWFAWLSYNPGTNLDGV